MQTAVLSPSFTPLLLRKPHDPLTRKQPFLCLRPLVAASSSIFTSSSSFHGLPGPRPLVSLPSLSDRRPKDALVPQVTSVPGSDSPGDGDAASKSGGMLQTLLLGSLFGLWYLFNIYFNINNKQVSYMILARVNTCNPLRWQLRKARCCDRDFCPLLQDSSFTHQLPWYWHCPRWSFLLLKAKRIKPKTA